MLKMLSTHKGVSNMFAMFINGAVRKACLRIRLHCNSTKQLESVALKVNGCFSMFFFLSFLSSPLAVRET